MAAYTPTQLNLYCALFGYFAEIDGDNMLAHLYKKLWDGEWFNVNTVRLI